MLVRQTCCMKLQKYKSATLRNVARAQRKDVAYSTNARNLKGIKNGSLESRFHK
jgi:hypothetical protein